MVCLKNKIADLLSTVGYNSHCSGSCEEVLFAVCKLKYGKDDGDIGLSSDYFLHAFHVSVSAWCCTTDDESEYSCAYSQGQECMSVGLV